jgi:hypothetical protein
VWAFFALLLWGASAAPADPSIAVLEFALRDLTPTPRTPEELERTASVRPLLQEALEHAGGLRLVNIDTAAVEAADAGFGYLFEHHDVAAELGRRHGADWILVGRVHKPSFLFAYLMAHLVDTHTGRLAERFIVEVKGPAGKATKRGVRRLAQKIHDSIHP